ncbi:MAG: hypothetical protein RI945_373 [Candidatus Parcubacteria bacterium]|jgi:hypothetical protein
MKKIFKNFDIERFEELAKAGFQPEKPLAKEKKLSLLKEVERLFIPLSFLDSLIMLLGGIVIMIFLPVLAPVLIGIFIENQSLSIILKIFFYLLGIYFLAFGIQQMFARWKYIGSYEKRLELLKEILLK